MTENAENVSPADRILVQQWDEGQGDTATERFATISQIAAAVLAQMAWGPTIPWSLPVVDYGTNSSGELEIDTTRRAVHRVTLGAATTDITLPSVPGVTSTLFFEMWLQQDGTGNRYVTWPDKVTWNGRYAPSLSTTPDTFDLFQFLSIDAGETWVGILAVGAAS